MASFHINGVSKTSSVYEIRVKCLRNSSEMHNVLNGFIFSMA